MRGGNRDFHSLGAVNRSSVLANGLVAWFPCPQDWDEQNQAGDFYENWTSGLESRPVTGLNSQIGPGWYYNTNTAQASQAIRSFASMDEPFTVAVWFTKIGTPGGNGTRLFALENSGGTDYLFNLSWRNTGVLRANRGDVAGNLDTAALTNGQTYLVVLTGDSAGATIYLDDATGATTSAAAAATAIDSGDAYRINPGGVTPNHILHDAKVWNRVLSREEISMLYHPATRWELHMPRRAATYAIPTTGGSTYNEAISEAATASDSVASTATLVGAISEVLAAAESISSLLTAADQISETATASDSLAGLLQAAGQLAEAASALDTVASLAVLVGALTETATATDTVNAGAAIYDMDVAETAAALDTITSQLVAAGIISETAAAADSVTALTVLLGALSEAGAALDTLASTGVLSVSIVEAGSAMDSVSAGGILLAAGERIIQVRFADRTVLVDQTGRVISVQLAARTIN
jgi:hypothetical protein